MVARGAGAVGCAHCTMLGADVACQVCKRLVCAACAAKWTSCGEPATRVVRLGASARLREIDPGGRYGLVTRWVGAPRVIDLRRLRWLDIPAIPRRAWSLNEEHRPKLTPDGRLLYPAYSLGAGERGQNFDGLAVHVLATGASDLIAVPDPLRGTGISSMGARYWYVTDREQVAVLAHDEAVPRLFDPLPRKVVQVAYLDGARDALAAATWGELAVHRIVDGRLVHTGRTSTSGTARWLAMAGSWLVAAIARAPHTDVIAWHLGAELAIGAIAHRLEVMDFDTASLSSDGRYLAVGAARRVRVLDLDSGDTDELDDHTDTLSLVQFAGDDHVLVTADHDNRIALRPRGPDGYAHPVVGVELPDDPIHPA